MAIVEFRFKERLVVRGGGGRNGVAAGGSAKLSKAPCRTAALPISKDKKSGVRLGPEETGEGWK